MIDLRFKVPNEFKELAGQFFHWTLYSFLAAISPLVFNIIILKVFLKPDVTIIQSIQSTISNAELILVCIPLLAANIGDIINKQSEQKWAVSSLIGMCLFFSTISSFLYVFIINKDSISINNSEQKIFQVSMFVLTVTLVLCISTMILPKGTRN